VNNFARKLDGLNGEVDTAEVVHVVVSPRTLRADDGGSNILQRRDGTLFRIIACVDGAENPSNKYRVVEAVQTYLPGRDRKIYMER